MNNHPLFRKIVVAFQDSIYIIFQLSSTIITFLLELLLRTNIERPDALKIPRGTLVISNHQNMLDPWFVTYHFGLMNCLNLVPVRYPVTPKYFRKPFLNILISCFGGYDIGLTTMEKAKKLLYTRELIQNRYVVLLFPEGQLVKNDQEQVDFKKGVDMLAQENVPILLVRLRGFNKVSWLHPKSGITSIRYSEIILDKSSEEKTRLIKNFFEVV